MDVFERIGQAKGAGEGINLSAADVELLMDLCGDAIAKAESQVEEWRERFADYDRRSADAGA